ncbi:MAG: DAK2 domain-containing protein [Actinobacteria bacterium]|nr:MAG: DAK2 domain-containing protein [Actinomycetota bacterium]
MAAGLEALRSREQEINSLNVFPVPDGDTGTNLVMTIESVCQQLGASSAGDRAEVMRNIVLGSLMGARGNSGVILSQIIRGVCEHFARQEDISAVEVADGLENGVKVAYQAIRKPVEGTMLTVIKDAAASARAAVERGAGDLESVLDAVVTEAGRSVARTPDLLPVLKEAGVVDAGGYGLLVLAEGIVGELLGREQATEALVGEVGVASGEEEADLTYRYCTEFIVAAADMNTDEAEAFLASLGGSIMVAVSPGLTRIHVHTNTPGAVIDWASAYGSLDQIKINDMAEQVDKRRAALAEPAKGREGTGVVAVVNGDGVRKIFESLGVEGFVEGGQTMNPSAAELVHAVEADPHECVILLPNNPNIVLTAQQVSQLTGKQIGVVATRTIPEGLAAVLAFEEEADLAENEQAMSSAAGEVKSGEITRAVRSGVTGDLKFRKGDLIGMFDGALCVTGRSAARTVLALLDRMVAETDSAITLVFGRDLEPAEAERIAVRVRRKYERLDIDVQEGGQPLYPVIIGVE